MAFNSSITLTDPNQAADPQDGFVVQALQQALANWSNYISGVGTLKVGLTIANLGPASFNSEYTIADGGPTSFSYGPGGAHGNPLGTPSSLTELTTGNHVAANDISITYNSSLLVNLASAQSPGLVTVMEHELEHGFGMSGFYSSYGLPVEFDASPFDANIQFGANTQLGGTASFTGPSAEANYGGPVPLTSSVFGSDYYHVGATGTSADPPVLQNDLMYPYLENDNATISGLDVALLKDSSVPITPAGYALIYADATLSASTGSSGGAAVTDPTVSGTTAAAEAIGIFIGGTRVGAATADAGGNWSFRDTSLADGTYTVTAAIFGGSGGTTSVATTLVLNATAPVQTLYQQVLSTGPDAATLAADRQSLVDGTSLASLRGTIASGADAQSALQATYLVTVGRAATTADLSRNTAELVAGATIASERAALATSGEEQTAIQGIFQNSVGRAATAADISRVEGEISTGPSLANERTALADSTEEQNEIQRVFQNTVGRAATSADLARVAGEIGNGGSILNDRAALATGTEAQNAIQNVFQSTVGRAASTADLSRVEGELASGGSLAADRAYLATSAEGLAAIARTETADTGTAPGPLPLLAAEIEIGSDTSLAGLRPLLAAQAGFDIVDARSPGSLAATAAPDLFLIGAQPLGATITGFDPLHDIVQIPAGLAANYAAIGPALVASGGGVHIAVGSVGVTLAGIMPAQLQASNFEFV